MAREIKVYKLTEVADILSVSVRSIYRWIDAGKLEAFRVGREWRVSQEALEAFMSGGGTKTDAGEQ